MMTSLLFADTLQQLTYDLVHYYAICDRVCTEQLGITATQGYTILAIPDHDSISMNDLSVRMKLANSTMTRMVDQLVQRKLADRYPDTEDRRVVRVQLTEGGTQAKAQLLGTLQDFFLKVLRFVPEGERETMLYNLATLNQAIMNTLKTCCGPD